MGTPAAAASRRPRRSRALIGGEVEAAGQESAALLATYYDNSGAQIGAETVWGGVDYSQSPPALQSGSFTTPPGTTSLRVGLAASVDNDVADGWLFFDRVALTALSQPIPIVPDQPLDIAANVRGVLDGPAGQTSGQLAAHFYDDQGNLLAVDPIWQTTDYNQPTTPQTHSGSASHATATQMRVGLMTVLDEGWLAFDTVKVTSLSAPITAQPNQYHKLTTQVSGQLNSAGGGRLFVQYSNGTIGYEWQNGGVFNGSQNVNGNFTTPATVSTFQVGTEVVLDKGHHCCGKVFRVWCGRCSTPRHVCLPVTSLFANGRCLAFRSSSFPGIPAICEGLPQWGRLGST